MGMIVHVLRSEGRDCTNHGASKTANELLVTNVPGPFDNDTMPRFRLVKGNIPGTAKLVSEHDDTEGTWTMFGGNFAVTSDSRWHRAVEQICGSRQSGAVPIHDREEG